MRETYDIWKWKVPLIQDTSYLEAYIAGMDIIGEEVKSVGKMGIGFSAEDNLVEYAHVTKQNSGGIWSDDLYFPRWLEIDEPFFIEFKSGNRIEIDFSEGSSLKLGKNSISSKVKSYMGEQYDIDPNVMYSLILGQQLIRVDIDKTDDNFAFHFTASRGIPEPKGKEFILGVRLVFSNGYQLHFYPEYDYGHVEILDGTGETALIYWSELRNGVTKEFLEIAESE